MCFFNSGGGDSGGSSSGGGYGIQTPASSVDPVVLQARQDAVKRFRAASGATSTILTKSTGAPGQPRGLFGVSNFLANGVSGGQSGGKTLLGQ